LMLHSVVLVPSKTTPKLVLVMAIR
jgi:hypothetical protein